MQSYLSMCLNALQFSNYLRRKGGQMKWRSNISASSSLTLDVFLLEVVGANPGTISTIPVNALGTFGNIFLLNKLTPYAQKARHMYKWVKSNPRSVFPELSLVAPSG